MKLLKQMSVLLLVAVVGIIISSVPVKAASGMPTNEARFLNEMMQRQINDNHNFREYIKLQELRSKAEKRPVSDIEMTKRQALEGMIQGNNNLLEMGAVTIGCGEASGQYNVAFMDQQAYEGYVSGMAALEKVKQDTWMQYTFRTH